MSPRVGLRWKLLVAIGLTIVVADQWTKFLAVKHLTPAITELEEQRDLGILGEIGAFYSQVAHPCDPREEAVLTPDGTVVMRNGRVATKLVHPNCPFTEFVPGFWSWNYVENDGAAFGFMREAPKWIRVPFFYVISFAAIIFIIAFFRRLRDDQRLLAISLSLVFGGAIGNFIDRLHLAYVIDFIDWRVASSLEIPRLCNGQQCIWPTFNVADASITSGVILLIFEWAIDIFRGRPADVTSGAAAEDALGKAQGAGPAEGEPAEGAEPAQRAESDPVSSEAATEEKPRPRGIGAKAAAKSTAEPSPESPAKAAEADSDEAETPPSPGPTETAQ